MINNFVLINGKLYLATQAKLLPERLSMITKMVIIGMRPEKLLDRRRQCLLQRVYPKKIKNGQNKTIIKLLESDLTQNKNYPIYFDCGDEIQSRASEFVI